MKLLLGILCLSVFAYGDEPNRENNLYFSLQAGSSSLISTSGEATLGLDPHWALTGGGAFTRSRGNNNEFQRTVDFQGGANVYYSNQFQLGGQIFGSRGPDNLSTFGGQLLTSWWLNALWDGEKQTVLNANVSTQRYSFSIPNGPPPRPPIDASLGEIDFTVGLLQELTSWWSIEASGTWYRYSVPPEQIGNDLINNRIRLNAGIGVVTEIPSYYWNLRQTFFLSQEVSTSLSVFQNRTAITRTLSQGLTAGVSYYPGVNTRIGAKGTLTRSTGTSTTWLSSLELELFAL